MPFDHFDAEITCEEYYGEDLDQDDLELLATMEENGEFAS